MREQKLNNITWISIVRPDEQELKTLEERLPQIHPLVLEELRSPTIRPSQVESYDHHLFMVLHFPNFLEGIKRTVNCEVDFIVFADTLITVQYESIPLMEGAWLEYENEKSMRDQYGKTPFHLLSYLTRMFFTFTLKELDQIQQEVDEIEEEVFSGRVKETLQDISILKRNLLDFCRSIKPQQLTLESLVHQGVYIAGEKVRPILTDLVGAYRKVWDLLENHKEALDALYDTNYALLTSKINETMRVFTILAFVSFIPTAIANMYGMNLLRIPLAGRPNAFWEVLAIMAFTTIVVYLILKWRKLV